MEETFGTGNPKDQDVVVLYKGEKTQVKFLKNGWKCFRRTHFGTFICCHNYS